MPIWLIVLLSFYLGAGFAVAIVHIKWCITNSEFAKYEKPLFIVSIISAFITWWFWLIIFDGE